MIKVPERLRTSNPLLAVTAEGFVQLAANVPELHPELQ